MPAVFGLGVLFSSAAPWAADARRVVEPYGTALVERLEKNRIELYVRVLELQAELDVRARAHQLQLDRLRFKLRELEASP